MSSNASFISIPVELVLKVAAHLDWHDQLALSHTNHILHNVFRSNLSLSPWTTISSRGYVAGALRETLDYVKKLAHSMQPPIIPTLRLMIAFPNPDTNDAAYNEQFSAAISRTRDGLVLRYAHISDAEWYILLFGDGHIRKRVTPRTPMPIHVRLEEVIYCLKSYLDMVHTLVIRIDDPGCDVDALLREGLQQPAPLLRYFAFAENIDDTDDRDELWTRSLFAGQAPLLVDARLGSEFYTAPQPDCPSFVSTLVSLYISQRTSSVRAILLLFLLCPALDSLTVDFVDLEDEEEADVAPLSPSSLPKTIRLWCCSMECSFLPELFERLLGLRTPTDENCDFTLIPNTGGSNCVDLAICMVSSAGNTTLDLAIASTNDAGRTVVLVGGILPATPADPAMFLQLRKLIVDECWLRELGTPLRAPALVSLTIRLHPSPTNRGDCMCSLHIRAPRPDFPVVPLLRCPILERVVLTSDMRCIVDPSHLIALFESYVGGITRGRLLELILCCIELISPADKDELHRIADAILTEHFSRGTPIDLHVAEEAHLRGDAEFDRVLQQFDWQ